jgi:hypothetical protein
MLPHFITEQVLRGPKGAAALEQNFEQVMALITELQKLLVPSEDEVADLAPIDLAIDEEPDAPEPGTLRLYVRDDGFGKAQLVVSDSNGVGTVLLTET